VKTSVKTAASVLPYLWAAIFIVFVWQMAVIFTQAHVALLPPPLLAAKTFAELVVNGQLFVHAGASLGRVISAWLLSAAVAIPLGLAMGRWRRFEHLVDPVIELFRPISPWPGFRWPSCGSASAKPARSSSSSSPPSFPSC